MSETPEARLKRLRIRAWRRGIKEMDLLFGHYADDNLTEMLATELDLFEAAMDEQDQELLAWITEQEPTPPALAPLLSKMVAHLNSKIEEKEL